MKKALFLFIIGLFSISFAFAQPTIRTGYKRPRTASPPVPSPVRQIPIDVVSSGKSYPIGISTSEALSVKVSFRKPLNFVYSPNIETLTMAENMLEFRVFETQTIPSNSAMTSEKCTFNEVNSNNFKAHRSNDTPALSIKGEDTIYTWTFLLSGLKKGTQYSVEVLNNQIQPMNGYFLFKRGMVGQLIPTCNRATVGGNSLEVVFEPIPQ